MKRVRTYQGFFQEKNKNIFIFFYEKKIGFLLSLSRKIEGYFTLKRKIFFQNLFLPKRVRRNKQF